MKHIFISTLFVLTIGVIQAQNSIETKTVEVENKSGELSVEITTSKNGEVVKEVLTGAEAENWLKENDALDAISNGPKNTSKEVVVSISKPDVKEIKKEIIVIQEQMNTELEKVAKKLSEIDIDSILKDIGIEVFDTKDSYHFEFKTEDRPEKSFVVIKSEEGKSDAREGVNSEQNDVPSAAHVCMIEDNLDYTSNLNLNELKIYPNLKSGLLEISFVSKSNDDCTVVLSDLNQTILAKSKTHGKGQKNLLFEFNISNPGIYSLTFTQGSKSLYKRILTQ